MVYKYRKRKYLIFATAHFPFGNGEEFINNEINHLSDSFERVYIISNDKKSEQTKDIPRNFEVVRLKLNLTHLFFLFGSVKKISDFTNQVKAGVGYVDIIKAMYHAKSLESEILNLIRRDNINPQELCLYSYWFNSFSYAISNIKYAYPEVRAVSRAHGYDLYKLRGVQVFKHETLSFLDALVPCSKQGEQYLIDNYGFADKVNCSYLGTENKYGFRHNKNGNIIVSCSYISPVKRIDLIIESLSLLDNECSNLTWIHIGDGQDKDVLIALAKKLLKNISFYFLGHKSSDEIFRFYNENDVKFFINLSSSEGLPVSMMEAQSFGIPIIATNVGGVSEIVSSETGILITNNPKPQDVKLAIEKMINLKPVIYESMRLNSYLSWKCKFYANDNYSYFIQKHLKGN